MTPLFSDRTADLNSVKVEVPWSGRPLKGPNLAWDTETTVVNLTTDVPDLVCLSASDGERAVVVFPRQVEKFWAAHLGFKRAAAFNLAFDWAVCRKWFDEYDCTVWERLTTDGFFGDTMLLEMLVRLAEGRDKVLYQLSLKKAAKEYLGIEIEKDAEIRTGFTPDMAREGEWQKHEKSWKYAADDAAVTFYLDQLLCERARRAIAASPFPANVDAWGLLTEQIQVRSAIVLGQVTRTGIAVNREAATEIAQEVKGRAESAVLRLESLVPGLIQVWPKKARKGTPGTPKLTKSGLPRFNLDKLRTYFDRLSQERGIPVPRTQKDNKVQLTAEYWTTVLPDDPLVQAWQDLQDSTASLELSLPLTQANVVHPRYDIIKSTGRTSAKGPAIQQTPREGRFRELYVARPGYKLVACDYSAIELRTLAACCEKRLGRSTLAEVLRDGIDPHRYTARLLLGLSESSFCGLDGREQKDKRQAAKALNFGIPGGLGATKLRAYAWTNYGVKLTEQEARGFRHRVITEVYPEWDHWLRDGLAQRLTVSLGCPVREVERVFGEDNPFMDPMDHPVIRVVAGHTRRKDGQKFASWFVNNVWQGLEHCLDENQNNGNGLPRWVVDRITEQEPGPDLAAYLVEIPCVTLTGRIRKKTFYGEYRNTQFQGLASDGAKLALWELYVAGYKIVAFIHDEILVEVPEQGAEDAAQRISAIMRDAFSRAMPGDIPIACEYIIDRCWRKP